MTTKNAPISPTTIFVSFRSPTAAAASCFVIPGIPISVPSMPTPNFSCSNRRLGAQISTTLTGHFITSADVVHILGEVFTALAQDRIPRKKPPPSATLARSCSTPCPMSAAKPASVLRSEVWIDLVNRSLYPAGSQVVAGLSLSTPAA